MRLSSQIEFYERRVNIRCDLQTKELPDLTRTRRGEIEEAILSNSKELNKLLAIKMEGIQVRNKLAYRECEERNFKYHKKQERRRGGQKQIPPLRDLEGNLQSSEEGREKIILDFYKTIYNQKETHWADQDHILSMICANIDSLDKEILDAPISQNDIMAAIKGLPTNKSPGPDGFTGEFFKFIKHEITPHLHTHFTNCFNSEQLLGTLHEANIILLHKKGDRANIGNYRPVSLLMSITKSSRQFLLTDSKKYYPRSSPPTNMDSLREDLLMIRLEPVNT
jgi:hypothetical protein